MDDMSALFVQFLENFPYLLLNISLVILLLGFVIALACDPYIDRSKKRVLRVIMLLIFSLIIQTILDDWLVGKPYRLAKTAVVVYGYCARPVLVPLVCSLLVSWKKTRPAWIIVGINAAIQFTAFFSPLVFLITPDNKYHRGPLGYTCPIVTGVLLVNLVYLTIRKCRLSRWIDALIPVFNTILIVAGAALDLISWDSFAISYLNIAIVISTTLYYIWLHLQFVREHEDDMEAQQRIRIMLAQIQPHFLYNSLGAIKGTIYDDPERARGALDAFAEYLRNNMDSLTDERPISFIRELEHVRQYLDLQLLRFENGLNVQYDLSCTDFFLPTLTIQPLVENAVTYGVRKNRMGRGTVTIRSREYPDHYEVSIIDDGPGFTAGNMPGEEERSHIGLQNVRERLRYICGGELQIHSVPGEGTTAVVLLPKEGQKKGQKS